MRNFDPAFFVTVVGARLYWGSSVDNSAHCFDAATGKEEWAYLTAGPVRLPPAIKKGKAYFGSDDGYAYCANAENGKLIWKHRAPVAEQFVSHNGRMIAKWPCRTGVTVWDGKAYFGFSLFPWCPSWFCSADAETGAVKGPGLYEVELWGSTLQGEPAASDKQIFVPQGRISPLVMDLQTGKKVGGVGGAGGTFCVLTPEGDLVTGPHNQKAKDNVLMLGDGKTRANILAFRGTTRIVIDGDRAYLYRDRVLSCLDRHPFTKLHRQMNVRKATQAKLKKEIGKLKKTAKTGNAKDVAEQIREKEAKYEALDDEIKNLLSEADKCYLWKQKLPMPFGLIKAGKLLIVGLENRVVAVDSAAGKEVWSSPVKGKAYGLAVANGCLFVSTDIGNICCFTSFASNASPGKLR